MCVFKFIKTKIQYCINKPEIMFSAVGQEVRRGEREVETSGGRKRERERGCSSRPWEKAAATQKTCMRERERERERERLTQYIISHTHTQSFLYDSNSTRKTIYKYNTHKTRRSQLHTNFPLILT